MAGFRLPFDADVQADRTDAALEQMRATAATNAEHLAYCAAYDLACVLVSAVRELTQTLNARLADLVDAQPQR